MNLPGELHLYTDGACSMNRGGFGCVLVNPITEFHKEIADGPYSPTTNNQMEMMSVIAGLEFVKNRLGSKRLRVFSDSQYVVRGINEWLPGWKSNLWFTSSNKPVKNQSLWKRMDAAVQFHEAVAFQWVKGHSGNRFNEIADKLAVAMRQQETNQTKEIAA